MASRESHTRQKRIDPLGVLRFISDMRSSVCILGLGLAAAGVLAVARGRVIRGRAHSAKASAAMHRQARLDAIDAFTAITHVRPTVNELRMLEAVALHETTFGAGWKGAGAGSFNMGAIQAGKGWTGETFGWTDTHPTATGGATSYDARFRKYATAVDGWKDLVRELYLRRSSVRRAAATGNPLTVAKAMRATGFYEGRGATEDARIRGYAQALADMLWEIDRAA